MGDIQEWKKIPLKKIKADVIEELKLGFAHDFLTEEEFEKRIVTAENTKKKYELLDLINDLPDKYESPSRDNDSSDININYGEVAGSDNYFSLMSSMDRRGPWKPPKKLFCTAIMGNIELDFTKAELPPKGVFVEATSIMANIELRVPEGVNVELSGFPILGNIENRSKGDFSPNAPRIKIRGFTVLGNIEIKGPKKSWFTKKIWKK